MRSGVDMYVEAKSQLNYLEGKKAQIERKIKQVKEEMRKWNQ